MKLSVLSLIAALSALALTGCRKNADTAGSEETILLGPQYSSKDGLLLPEETRRSLGVEVAEVTEQKVARTVEFQARVYRNEADGSIATGSLGLEQAKLLKIGQSVRLHAPNGEDRLGNVSAVNSELPQAADMAEVLVKIPGSTEIGTSFGATATMNPQESSIAVPRSALLQSISGYSVYTVNGEHFVRTPVEIGASNTDLVEIKDGLFAGDKVVTQPVMSLWMTELAAVKGGQACCVVPAKGK